MRRIIAILSAALLMAAMMVGAAPAAFAQADVYRNVIRHDTTVFVGGEPVEGERRVSSHQVRTPSGNRVQVLDVHERYENGYRFHSHSVIVDGEVKNAFVKDNS